MKAHTQSPGAGAQADFFRDLCRRNERRARLARTRTEAAAEREPRPELDRVGESYRQRRFRRDP